jgi:hypothetical protein
MSTKNKIIKLTKQLFPEGRALRIVKDGNNEKRETALAEIKSQGVDSAYSILYSILPDNDFFTEDDATKWERRLGMIVQNSSVPLADRKAAILRKYNHPGTILARQSYDYLQDQLNLAGFTNVVIYENIPRLPPSFYCGIQATGIAELGGDCQFSPLIEHGQIDNGSVFGNMIANHIDEIKDYYFDIGDNLSALFYVSGTPNGTFIDISASRKEEFRQLIMKLKPANTVGVLFVNYV